jgi:hypothetical protein
MTINSFYIPAVDQYRCLAILGILEDTYSKVEYGTGELRNAVVWPSGEVEIFHSVLLCVLK